MKANRNLGRELIEGLEEAVAIERGQATPARMRRLPRTARDSVVAAAPAYPKRRVRGLRSKLKLSQTVFARALNVSAEAVRAWEQGKRRPDGAVLRLLQFSEREPRLLLSVVRDAPRRQTRRD